MAGKTLMDLLIERLDRLETKIDAIGNNGCAKASNHVQVETAQSELFKRIRLVEERQAEGRGRLAVAVAVASVCVSFFLQWIGKHL